MPQKYCRKFQPPEQGARALQTIDRQTTDRRTGDSIQRPRSRSLKTGCNLSLIPTNQECCKIFLCAISLELFILNFSFIASWSRKYRHQTVFITHTAVLHRHLIVLRQDQISIGLIKMFCIVLKHHSREPEVEVSLRVIASFTVLCTYMWAQRQLLAPTVTTADTIRYDTIRYDTIRYDEYCNKCDMRKCSKQFKTTRTAINLSPHISIFCNQRIVNCKYGVKRVGMLCKQIFYRNFWLD